MVPTGPMSPSTAGGAEGDDDGGADDVDLGAEVGDAGFHSCRVGLRLPGTPGGHVGAALDDVADVDLLAGEAHGDDHFGVRSWPARPTNGSPLRSSSSPGPSPTNISFASGLPTPKTTLWRRAARWGHLTQAEARAARWLSCSALVEPVIWRGGSEEDSGRRGSGWRGRSRARSGGWGTGPRSHERDRSRRPEVDGYQSPVAILSGRRVSRGPGGRRGVRRTWRTPSCS